MVLLNVFILYLTNIVFRLSCARAIVKVEVAGACNDYRTHLSELLYLFFMH